MLAGGSGITPMYQVALHILRDSNDDTQLSLIYANVQGGCRRGGWLGEGRRVGTANSGGQGSSSCVSGC